MYPLRRTASAGPARMNAYSSSGVPSSSSGSSLMPHRRPDFSEGSIIEEKDSRTQRTVARYRVGPLLGQGGFAKAYDVKDLETGEHLALKVCERQKLIQTRTLGRLQTEIAVHRRMNHKNIVKLHRSFQDEWNVYIVLELCRGTTLMDLSKNRKRFTPQETQFVMVQLLMACQYMHQNHVIHRDLKLGNIMMDENMNVKVGDFGLAAELAYDGQRKRTVCGTPNYIAPEIIANGRDGHSFEVDTWSVGVILYTLLVGEPPFQTSDVKNTYSRIKQCQYNFPLGVDVSQTAKELIHRILQSNPDSRPSLMDIRNHPFLSGAATVAPMSLYPSRLRAEKEAKMAREREQQQQNDLKKQVAPSSSTSAPASGRDPLRPVTNGVTSNFPSRRPSIIASTSSSNNDDNNKNTKNEEQQAKKPPVMMPAVPLAPVTTARANSASTPTEALEQQQPVSTRPTTTTATSASARTSSSSPLPAPPIWVYKICDYTEKYGLAYRLSTGQTGCYFNDRTKIVWDHNATNRAEYYTDRNNMELVRMAQDTSEDTKKQKLIRFFKHYFDVGGKPDAKEQVVRCSPYLYKSPPSASAARNMTFVTRFVQAPTAIGFEFNNNAEGLIQVCFTKDNTEIFIDKVNSVVTFTNRQGHRKSLTVSAVKSDRGSEMAEKMSLAEQMMSK